MAGTNKRKREKKDIRGRKTKEAETHTDGK